MDTLPMPLDALAAAHGGLGDFLITSPSEIKAMLTRLLDGNVVLNLNAPDGSAVVATLWSVDPARGVISFSAPASDPQLQPLIDADEAVVVGYLDNVKLQFDVHNMVLVHRGRESALSCAYPYEMYRFQRRGSYRVRPVQRTAPTARLRHPVLGDVTIGLRILDISLGGCALFLPQDISGFVPGTLLEDVDIELDADTQFTVRLRLHHLSAVNAEIKGSRMGCELVRPTADVERRLQRYIDQTQKRRRLMTLD